MKDTTSPKIRAMQRHLEHLVQSHRDLDQKIIDSQSNTSYDKIKEMKYEKLQLRKTIDWYERELERWTSDHK